MFKQEHKHFCLMSSLLTSLKTTQGTLLQLPFFCSWWMYCPLISRSTKFMMWRSLAPCFPKSFSSTFSCFYSCLSSRVHSQTSENPCLSPRASPRQNCRRAEVGGTSFLQPSVWCIPTLSKSALTYFNHTTLSNTNTFEHLLYTRHPVKGFHPYYFILSSQ